MSYFQPILNAPTLLQVKRSLPVSMRAPSPARAPRTDGLLLSDTILEAVYVERSP